MATYSTEALVLSKTKLGDSDLILTLLAHDGSRIRAVAKGARKTRSKLGGTVELFCQVDLLLAEGRNLDIVSEARTVDSHEGCRRDLEHSSAASVVCEMLAKLSLEGQVQERLYDMSCAALAAIAQAETPRERLIVAAALMKTLCLLGYRPSLEDCVGCGCTVRGDGGMDGDDGMDGDGGTDGDGGADSVAAMGEDAISPLRTQRDEGKRARTLFSLSEGGVVCGRCGMAPADAREMDAGELDWIAALTRLRYRELLVCPGGDEVWPDLLRFCELWLVQNTGVHLKSLPFMYLT